MDSEEIDKLNVTTTVWRDGWTTKDDVIAIFAPTSATARVPTG